MILLARSSRSGPLLSIFESRAWLLFKEIFAVSIGIIYTPL